ncbi:MAG: hypothetical protein JWO46_1415 [Nocardioidaceae bacterium]|nr:hypothetical protein [Nocardioidaceae bacterium]
MNVGRPQPNPYKTTRSTGIGKVPQVGPVDVREPSDGTSGIAGDHIGDAQHHGGSRQALYAFAREDLDAWEETLGRELPDGFFGENLTLVGIDPNEARVGERWRIGDVVEVEVTDPRVPCATFRGWLGQPGWLRTFTEANRPGAYLRIVTPGSVEAGDEIVVLHRPDGETISEMFHRVMRRG